MPLFSRKRSSSQHLQQHREQREQDSISNSGSSIGSSGGSGLFSAISRKYPTPSKLAGAMSSSASPAQAYLAALGAVREVSSSSRSNNEDNSDMSSIYTHSSSSGGSSMSMVSDATALSMGSMGISSGGSQRRSRGYSLSAGEPTVFSNDYGLEFTESAAEHLSIHPPKEANKLAPVKHFDANPFYVPAEYINDPHATPHAEFGYQDEKFEYRSQFRASTGVGGEEIEEPALITYITTYMSYLILIVLGHIRDFVGKRTHRKSYQHLMPYNVRLSA
jgi:serine palmitoyltransferase